MINDIKCSKKEYDLLIEQLEDEGIDYEATETTTITKYQGRHEEKTKYAVLFFYDGKML